MRSATVFDKNDFRRILPRFQGDNFESNLELVTQLEEMAKQKNCTVGQLAIAWVLAKGEFIVPIPGTKHSKYLEENVAAAAVTLSRDEVESLDRISSSVTVKGERYPQEAMRVFNMK